ncbi:MAG: hypothetical protein PHD53_00050 [Methylococcales bacterium]|nr:hypothetical protein [Methylococcales bacterium]
MQIISVIPDKTDSFSVDTNHITISGKIASVLQTESSDAINCVVEFAFNDSQFKLLKATLAAI